MIWQLFCSGLLYFLASALEHERSFFVQDGAAIVHSLALYQDSLLYTSSNDIVQKDIETGHVQRSFRAHTNTIYGIIVTNDSRMISAGWDDMIVVWNLASGSIIKRILLAASNTYIISISYQNGQLFTGGDDRKARQIDLNSGRALKTITQSVSIYCVIAKDSSLYLGQQGIYDQLEKVRISSSSVQLRYQGHSDSVPALYLSEDLLFSGSVDRMIICWNSTTGVIIRKFAGHVNAVSAIVVVDDELYSGSWDISIIKWNKTDGRIIKAFPVINENIIKCVKYWNNSLFAGSADTSIIKWNVTTGNYSFIYTGRIRKIFSITLWSSFIISAGEDFVIRLWDSTVNSIDASRTIYGHGNAVNALLLYEETLFSGSSDSTIRQWQLEDFTTLKILTGHQLAVDKLASDDVFLYSGGIDTTVRQWDILTGDIVHIFMDNKARVNALAMNGVSLISCSDDNVVRLWNIETKVATLTITSPSTINDVVSFDEKIISSGDYITTYNFFTGELLVEVTDVTLCNTLLAAGSRIFSGHNDGRIKSRDSTSLTVLEIYQGHVDSVMSVCIDNTGTMFSSGFDGSIKKWNMATRKVAFSFEYRNNSVTTLAVNEELLFVGTKSGIISSFAINNATLINSAQYHTGIVSSLLNNNGSLYSVGEDGRLLKYDPRAVSSSAAVLASYSRPLKGLAYSKDSILTINGDTEIIIRRFGSQEPGTSRSISSTSPLLCVSVANSKIIAGSQSGIIFAWDIVSLQYLFELRGHTAQVNFILIDIDSMFSASSDKTIIQWSLLEKTAKRTLKRTSANSLGHVGPVSSLTTCNGVLFSAGLDNSVRRWNMDSGKHEDVYFGFFKPVTSVLCHNESLFAGSEDFAVLEFRLLLPEYSRTERTIFTPITSRRVKKKLKLTRSPALAGDFSSSLLTSIIGAIVLFLALLAASLLYYRSQQSGNKRDDIVETNSTGYETTTTETDLNTVINSVMGLSKHANYLIENSSVARIKKIAFGGGGEIFIAKMTSSTAKSKVGETVIQKEVFIKNKTSEEAFHQEVGVMIMLNNFPHFCSIFGYTEQPSSIILKYYPDGSLFHWLRKNQMSIVSTIKILKEISEALSTMHRQFLAHCDLKTQNVLVEVQNGVPSCYLTDFGITQVLSETIIAAKAFHVINLRGLSVPYAAPEAFKSFRSKNYYQVDFKKNDTYSLACVIYEVLLRKGPWD